MYNVEDLEKIKRAAAYYDEMIKNYEKTKDARRDAGPYIANINIAALQLVRANIENPFAFIARMLEREVVDEITEAELEDGAAKTPEEGTIVTSIVDDDDLPEEFKEEAEDKTEEERKKGKAKWKKHTR